MRAAFGKAVVGAGLAFSLLAVAACAPQQGPRGPFQGGERGRSDNRPPGEESYSQALAMRKNDGCAAAIPPLRRFAERGGGFEIAQFVLGDCLVEEARAAEEVGTRQEYANEAMDVLLKAANSNEPNAQGLLAEIYFNGDIVARNDVEAAKWLLLYKRNNLRLNVGARSLPAGLEISVRNRISEADWRRARALADEFQVVVQETVVPEGGEEEPPEVRGGEPMFAPGQPGLGGEPQRRQRRR